MHGTAVTTNGTNPPNNWAERLINNLQVAVGFFMGAIGTVGANVASPKYFLESMMVAIQEYAIAIMFILLPLVVIFGLLPIFGNNYKLILKYAFSFFLIKLWIPVYWLIYVAMLNVSSLLVSSAAPIHSGLHYIDNGIQYAITTFVGNPAYAQAPPPPTPVNQPPPPTPASPPGTNVNTSSSPGIPPSSSTQVQSTIYAMEVANEAEKWSALNAALLAFFAVAIPGVFGSAATYLIGKGTMEAGLASLVEGLKFMQSFGRLGAAGLAKGLGKFGGSIGSAAGTVTRMGTNTVKSGVGAVNDFWQNRQYTKELQRSELGGIAKDFGIKSIRSSQQEINSIFRKANIRVQDKGDGVIAFYDRNGLLGIRSKDGSYHGVKFMSEEDRKKYGNLDLNRTYGLIDKITGEFIQAKGSTPINKDRIGLIKNMEVIRNLNKML